MTIKKLKSFINDNRVWLAPSLALIGLAYYLYFSWHQIHTLPSLIWDESMYLHKGYLFASGQTRPYEDFGLWTNHMPLGYLLFGYAQVLFGAGLQTGRIMAMCLGGLALVGLWLAARRQGNMWWAAAAVWGVALNIGWMKGYSMALSQVIVSFFFAWMLAFALGESRRTWELGVAAVFASLAGLTRINVLPVVFLLIVYVFWQYGKKAGWITAAAGILPLVLVHLLYWPDILKLWAAWVPANLFPFLDRFRSPLQMVYVPDDFSWWDIRVWINDPSHLVWTGLDFFMQGIRANLLPLLGVIAVCLLWPAKTAWKSDRQRKSTIFLLVVYASMFAVHTWAAIGGNSCLFSCYAGYFLFFNVFGIMVFISAVSALRRDQQRWRTALVIAVLLLIFLLITFNFASDYKDVRSFIVYDIFGAEVDRMQDQKARNQPEASAFWQFFREKFGFNRYTYFRFFLFSDQISKALRWIIAACIAVLFPLLGWYLSRRYLQTKTAFAPFALFFVIGFTAVFSYLPVFGQALDFESCQADMLQHYDDVGEELAGQIPAGSLVFWQVKLETLLFSLSDQEIFLPQSNFVYAFTGRQDIDPEELLRFGWWNTTLGEEWIGQADYIAVQAEYFEGRWHWDQRVENGEFNIIYITQPVEVCTGGKSRIILLEPNP